MEGLFKQDARDNALNLLRKQTRYNNAVRLCAVNSAVHQMCKTDAGRKIMKELESEDCLEVMIQSVTISFPNEIMLIYVVPGSGEVIELNTFANWEKLLKLRKIPRQQAAAMQMMTIPGKDSFKDKARPHWPKIVAEVMRKWPFFLKLNHRFATLLKNNGSAWSSIDNIIAHELFQWQSTSKVPPADLVQLLELEATDLETIGADNFVSFDVTLNYERWTAFFQRGLSQAVTLFKNIDDLK